MCECELLLEDVDGTFLEEGCGEGVALVCDGGRDEAVGADALLEEVLLQCEALPGGGDGGLEGGLGEVWMVEDGDELVCFAGADGGCDGGDVEDELFEMRVVGERGRGTRRGREKGV